MAEPASTTVVASTAMATAATATALLPGVDGNALVGALAGGALFVTHAKDLPLWQRALYLLISAGGGYAAAPDVMQLLSLHSTGLAAFIAGAIVVTFTTALMKRAESGDLSSIFTKPGA